MENLKAGLGCLGLVIVVGIVGFFMAFQTVPAGTVGVVVSFGQVREQTLPSGLHFVIPFVEDVNVLDTRVQSHEFGTQDGQPIEAASKEYQAVYLSGKFNYHVDGAYASVLYRTVGEDFANRIIDPAFKDIVKEIVPTYAITDILPNRDEIRSRTIELLNANLARYHIIIDDVYFANIGFSPEYEAAIEAKQVAQQQVETEREIKRQLEVKAEQKVIEARGEADAQIERAKGQAQSSIETAKGTAEANRLLNESLTPVLIQYEYIRSLREANVVYLPSDGSFLLNIPSGQQP